MMNKFVGYIFVVFVFFAACVSATAEVKSFELLRASVLDLRYKSAKFDGSRISVVGYFPEENTDNFLKLYATRESAKSRDAGFEIWMIAATDEMEAIRDQCGSGKVILMGYFTANDSPSGGIIAVERITVLEGDKREDGLPLCWSLN